MARSYYDKFGYRRQSANPISRVGVFPYTGEQIDQPKKDPKTGAPMVKRDALGDVVYKRTKGGAIKRDADGNPIPEYEMQFGLDPNRLYPVLRGPDALFDPAAIESFNGLPIRVGHLMIGDEKKNDKNDADKKLNSADKNPNDGCIYNVRPSLDEPGYLIADFCIYTDRMKDVLREGKVRQLSLGYTCIYEQENGEYEGVPYMFRQTNLRGNHLALVKHGRCGSSVCVYDQAVVTFDSLPEGNTSMENPKKEETGKLDRAKALASAIKGGDEQLAQDCLDFADFPPEVRKEALERCKAGKCEKKDGEKEATDKAPKAAKDADDVPVPPSLPKPEEKPAESPAPETAAASAPVPSPAPEAEDPPPAEVKSPVDGEDPSVAKDCKDKAPKAVCDKCGADPCVCKNDAEKDAEKGAEDKAAKAAKDCGSGVTDPSIPTPVAALQGGDDKKADEDKSAEAKDCKDKSPVKEDEPQPGEEIAAAIEGKEAEDKAAKKPEDKSEDKPEGKPEDKKPPFGKPKVAQDEYAAFIAEYSEAQALATKLRPHIKVAFDSAPMRVIDVARFAAKNIDNLAFVMDEADDEKVLTAVRGYAAAVAMDAAPKGEVFEDRVPSGDVIVQDEAPKSAAKAASGKDLLAFLGN